MDPIYPCQTHSRHHPIFPTILRTLNLSHRDTSLQAAHKLTHALQNLNNANPLSQLSDDQLQALHQLSTLFPPGLWGWSTIHHRNHPRVPLLPLNHTTTCVLDLTIHRRHHPRVLVLPLNHATTCVLDLTTPPPSPTLTPADLWNTATSLRIPPLATSGSALPPIWTTCLRPPRQSRRCHQHHLLHPHHQSPMPQTPDICMIHLQFLPAKT